MSVVYTFQSCSRGCHGAMVNHPILWHTMGTISSEAGVQQGDPLGPLLFCLVLQKVVSAIAADSVCSELLFHAWYLDNGVVSGPRLAVENALSIIQELGPPLGLFVNPTKFELFTPSSLVADALSLYSDDIRQCFTECTSPQTMLGNRPNLASVGVALDCDAYHTIHPLPILLPLQHLKMVPTLITICYKP